MRGRGTHPDAGLLSTVVTTGIRCRPSARHTRCGAPAGRGGSARRGRAMGTARRMSALSRGATVDAAESTDERQGR